MQNMLLKYFCETCDYKCSKKSCWIQHTLTAKHQKANGKLMPANKKYACNNCNIIFKHQSSYCRHKNKCKDKSVSLVTMNEEITDKEIIANKNLIVSLVKQNSELLELVKNGTQNNTNNFYNNSNNNFNNKTFNLNFFLNETCKDAMNITDFVDSIKLQLIDLESVGKLGYVEGITNIITSKLKALDITQRPIHCTDKKRETLYIKDENKWEKEYDDKRRLRKAIKKIASKNIKLLSEFKELHPDCNKSVSLFSDQYNKIIVESMGGPGDNDTEKEDKIIKNIAKKVAIEK